MRVLLLVLIIIHGLLHVPGFVKAFKLSPLNQMPHPISKTNGVLWLVASVLVILSGILFYTFTDGWWIAGIVSVVVSQYVIIKDWEDAGLGTTLNILLLLISILGFILT
jgi:hypothetical protein